MEIAVRKERLLKYIEKYINENIIVAFSGGVDSSLLLKMICDCAKSSQVKIYAVMAKTKLHPASDEQVAESIAKECGAIFKIIEINELEDAGINNNPKDRCYRCKKHIFGKIVDVANDLGVKVIFDGTNEDDLHVYRPGLKALKEYGIKSPLAECEITKEDVRTMAYELGISVANRPSTPCLATRLPYDTPISYELLEKIDICESYIRQLGFGNVRVRIHGDICRIEIDGEQFEKFLTHRKEIADYLHILGTAYFTLDINGFMSGSMDINIK